MFLIAQFYLFSEIFFDLIVEREPIILGLKKLEEAVQGFLYICFTVNVKYPMVRISAKILLD